MGTKGLLLVLYGVLFLCVMGISTDAGAQVGINVRIGPPPAYNIAAPPPVVVIPGTYVYLVPDIAVDIFFYHGFWYRLHEGHWFRSQSYNGGWVYLPPERVPQPLLRLPPDYRSVPPGYRRIPYADLRKNWSGWEKNRYWDKDKEWREGWHGKPEERGRGEGGMRPGPERREGGEEHHEHEGH